MTKVGQTVKYEVLTDGGQNVHDELLTDVGKTVECEVLRDGGQTVQCAVLSDVGHIVQCVVLTDVGQTVQCEVLRDVGHIVQCEVLTDGGQTVHSLSIFRFAYQCVEEGTFLLFLFVLISQRPSFITLALCELLNVTVEALCSSLIQ
jgi:predicted HD phosphohydrolase